MNTLSLYIAKRIFRSILTAFIIVLSVIMLVDFVESSRSVDSADSLSPLTMLTLTALKAPVLIEQTIPFVVLFGVMGALFGLNKRSELTVMRAAGLSAWRFLLPAVTVTGLIGLIWTLGLNPLASASMDLRERLLSVSSETPTSVFQSDEIWLREGNEREQTVIYARSADLFKRTLYDATFTFSEADDKGELVFSKRFDAKKAVLLPSNYWQLTDVIENTIEAETSRSNAMSWPTSITVKELQSYNEKTTFPPFWDLPGEIQKTDQAGFSSVGLRMQFNKLLALPLSLIAMTVIAACVSMQQIRGGGTLRLMLSGGILGFGVYFVENIIRAFGEAGTIGIPLAVWAIPLLVLFAGIAVLSRLEDG